MALARALTTADAMASMPEHPESFPVNALVPIEGTPLENNEVRRAVHRDGECGLSVYRVRTAGPIPDHPAHDLYGENRAARDYHPACGWTTNARRDAAGHVFHGGRQCGLYGRTDVDHAL